MTEQQERIEVRYSLLEQDNHPISALLGPELSELNEAELLDLSQHGAKLIAKAPVEKDAECFVSTAIESLSFRETKRAHVRWWDVLDVGRCMVGLQFVDPVPLRKLDHLVQNGVLCRRKSARVELQHPVKLNRQLDQDPVSGMVLDISDTGVRICTEVELQVAERIVLPTEFAHEFVVCKVIWMSRSTGAFTVGCEFETAGAREVLLQAYSKKTRRIRGQKSDSTSQTIPGI